MLNILITNDDGIRAKGIRSLIEMARPFGNITVVAPQDPMSGMGHAITVNRPLRLTLLKKEKNYQEYVCTGTPVDCVKMGLKVALENQKVDLVISGINHGSNVSSNVIYSGTMGAAIEAAIEGIKSIGFSLLDYSHDADFSQAEEFIKKIIANVIETQMPKGIALNVNIPKVNKEDIKGIRMCTQGDAYWVEEYIARKDPWNGDYYWLAGEFVDQNVTPNSDIRAVAENYIAIVPVQYDLTAFQALEQLKHFNS